MQPLDLPSNWLVLHPGLKKEVIDSIYSRCNTIINNFAYSILGGKRKLKALLSLPFDIAIIPVAIGYYFIGRFFLAKTLIATHACNSCEKCVKQCPVESIIMIDQRPFWKYNCESCMRCVNACPKRAIETTHTYSGFLVLFSSLIISPLVILGISALEVYDWFIQSALTGHIVSIINTIVFLGIVFLSYRILHYLMKFKWINKIILYSSFSSYKFWRRYKPPVIGAK